MLWEQHALLHVKPEPTIKVEFVLVNIEISLEIFEEIFSISLRNIQ